MAPWLMKLELYITSNVPETKQSLKGCLSGGSLTSMMWFANCQHQKKKKFPQITCCTHFSCHNFYALYVYVKISQGVLFCIWTLQNITKCNRKKFRYVMYCCHFDGYNGSGHDMLLKQYGSSFWIVCSTVFYSIQVKRIR